MSWINPLFEDHQRKRWLRPDWLRFMKPNAVAAKSHVARQRAQDAALAAEWDSMREDLQVLSWHVKDLRRHLALRRLSLKYDGQPRDDRGRFAEGRQGHDSAKDPGMVTRHAFLVPAVRIAVQKGIEAALALYAAMSARNTRGSTAILEFNARAFQTQPVGDPKPETAKLTREQVDEVCPRREEVQSITNQAAASIDRGAYQSDAAYGTAVHKLIKDEIDGPETVPPSRPADPNFRAEVSAIKSGEVRYGTKGSIRVDVFENPNTGTVCIYDIKTGESGLSFPRMQELATKASMLYPGTQRIIVSEVRPAR